MSVYSTPEEHDANPPSTWVVTGKGKQWQVRDQRDVVLEHTTTKHAAEEAINTGFMRRLYDTEGRWYAGESIPNWKPWAQVQAENVALAALQAARIPEQKGPTC